MEVCIGWKRNQEVRGEEESEDKAKWVEMRVTGDLWQEDSSKSESEGLEDGSEMGYEVWFGALTKRREGELELLKVKI